MARRRVALILTLCGLSLAALGRPAPARPRPPGRQVAVAAAADLRFALDALAAAFHHRHPDIEVTASYGSSGALYAQIVNRAPFDVFLSADRQYPARLEAGGQARPGTAFVYAVGRLAVWTPQRSSLDVERLGLAALGAPAVKHVAIANPEHAPYGRAALAALQQSGLLDRLRPKLVYAENVGQALHFVEAGAAEAGLVALSLAVAPAAAARGRYWLVPPHLYPRMDQGAVMLSWARDPAAVQELRAFLQSDEGRAILQRFGFDVEEG